MKNREGILVEMFDHGILDLWRVDSSNYFHGMELLMEPWIRYGFSRCVAVNLDKGLLWQRTKQLNGDVKIWKDFDANNIEEIFCMTIHPKERLGWISQEYLCWEEEKRKEEREYYCRIMNEIGMPKNLFD
jgi:hypothetical protein